MEQRPFRRALACVGLSLAVGFSACAGNRSALRGSCSTPSSWGPSSWGSAPAPGLVGGVTDDNARLPEYLAYVDAYPHGDVPKLDLTDRRIVTVVGDEGTPLWDVDVRVHTGEPGGFQARTNTAGQFLFPAAALGLHPGAHLGVHVGGGHSYAMLDSGADVLAVPGASRRWAGAGVPLDVALVVDTTGSMADEVDRLRSTLVSVVARIGQHPLHPRVRIGGVAYRDVGDQYVTRTFPFTTDMAQVQRTLDGMVAAGGGDGPEAVQEALADAVHGLPWGGEGTVRILFLVGDAPPHFERGTPYTETLRDALARGITVVPIACSDMDDRGEFVWRQAAAVTMGEFLFVSYGGGTEHHTGPYLENDLDRLMLRAVGRHLDALASVRTVPVPGRVAFAPGQAPSYAPVPVPVPVPSCPASADRLGFGRAPWDFATPGWPRR